MNDLLRDIGELLWFGFEGTTAPPLLADQIARGACGAVIIFRRNLVKQASATAAAVGHEAIDVEAIVALNRSLHEAAPKDSPLLIAVDQEGGVVQRVRAPATVWPPMRRFDEVALAPGEDVALAEAVGEAMGRELAALGFDIDFAPILDIHTNDANPIIGDRAFGRNAADVSRRALAFARGMERAGMLGCGKHFPGHGDTTTDSHLELPRVDQPWSRLQAVELAPFAAAAHTSMPMIMTAHVVFAALDDQVPATLSGKVIDGLLRKQLGYQGVIVSDDLDMKAVADNVGVAVAAVSAIRAGCDVLLCCRDLEHQRIAFESLREAAQRDANLRTRVAESAARVRNMKRQHGSLLAAAGGRPSLEIIGCAEHAALAKRLA